MQRVLVVYFSRTGYTRKIAADIAAACGADIERIQEPRDRSGIWGYLRSGREAWKKRLVDIRPVTKHPPDYDLIVLGTPVWASNICSPVRSYIAAHGHHFKKVAFFCTQGGSGAEKVLNDMAELCGQTPVATLVLTDTEIKHGQHADKLNQFLRSLARQNAA